jgi:hypothetical protein
VSLLGHCPPRPDRRAHAVSHDDERVESVDEGQSIVPADIVDIYIVGIGVIVALTFA